MEDGRWKMEDGRWKMDLRRFSLGLQVFAVPQWARKFFLALLLLFLAFVWGPGIGQGFLWLVTSEALLQEWRTEAEKLDSIFPRNAANEARRLELIRKLRQRGQRIDEGVDESIDHKDTPYAITARILRDWERLFGW